MSSGPRRFRPERAVAIEYRSRPRGPGYEQAVSHSRHTGRRRIALIERNLAERRAVAIEDEHERLAAQRRAVGAGEEHAAARIAAERGGAEARMQRPDDEMLVSALPAFG